MKLIFRKFNGTSLGVTVIDMPASAKDKEKIMFEGLRVQSVATPQWDDEDDFFLPGYSHSKDGMEVVMSFSTAETRNLYMSKIVGGVSKFMEQDELDEPVKTSCVTAVRQEFNVNGELRLALNVAIDGDEVEITVLEMDERFRGGEDFEGNNYFPVKSSCSPNFDDTDEIYLRGSNTEGDDDVSNLYFGDEEEMHGYLGKMTDTLMDWALNAEEFNKGNSGESISEFII